MENKSSVHQEDKTKNMVINKLRSKHQKKKSEPPPIINHNKILNKLDGSRSKISQASRSRSHKSRKIIKIGDIIQGKGGFRKSTTSNKSRSLLNRDKSREKANFKSNKIRHTVKNRTIDLSSFKKLNHGIKKEKNIRILWDKRLSLKIQSEIYFGECVGQGSFARVYEAHDKVLRVPVAVKVIDKRKMKDDRRKMLIQREVYILSQMESEYISEFYRLLEDGKRIYIVMELCGGNTLSRLAKKRPRNRFKENEAKNIFN